MCGGCVEVRRSKNTLPTIHMQVVVRSSRAVLKQKNLNLTLGGK